MVPVKKPGNRCECGRVIYFSGFTSCRPCYVELRARLALNASHGFSPKWSDDQRDAAQTQTLAHCSATKPRRSKTHDCVGRAA